MYIPKSLLHFCFTRFVIHFLRYASKSTLLILRLKTFPFALRVWPIDIGFLTRSFPIASHECTGILSRNTLEKYVRVIFWRPWVISAEYAWRIWRTHTWLRRISFKLMTISIFMDYFCLPFIDWLLFPNIAVSFSHWYYCLWTKTESKAFIKWFIGFFTIIIFALILHL